MAKSQSTSAARPRKPHPEYPLFPHRSGQWAKKIKGRTVYFGAWADPDAALNRFLHQRDDLYAGRKPRPVSEDGFNVRDAINHFLTAKQQQVAAGDISPSHFNNLRDAGEFVAELLGKTRVVDDLRPDDFRQMHAVLSKRFGSSALKRWIANIKQPFNWCYKNALIERPVQFGTDFKPPSQKRQRLDRQRNGSRAFTAEQLRALVDAADGTMRAMILVGANAAYGNADVRRLEFGHLDLKGGWATFARPKTGVFRRAKLWSETVAALQESIATRKSPKQPKDSQLIFITRCGSPFGSDDSSDSPITKEFRKLLGETEIYRPGLSFYSLRHTFRTVADEVADAPAIDCVMGHTDSSMASIYRQAISDERLAAVAKNVRQWLFGSRKPK